jgi:hypothetical protein
MQMFEFTEIIKLLFSSSILICHISILSGSYKAIRDLSEDKRGAGIFVVGIFHDKLHLIAVKTEKTNISLFIDA